VNPALASLLVLALTACAPAPQRPAAPAFALFGDAPYSQAQANLLDSMIDEMNAEPLQFAVHLGDITSGTGPCDDEWIAARQRQFARIRHPFVLIFGDNEWTDCHRSGFDPLERLGKLRSLFHAQQPPLARFERQSRTRPEHARWVAAGMLFVTLNVPGSNNNLGRSPAMDAEHAARMEAVFDWLEDAVSLAEAPDIGALVVLMHANPLFEGAAPRPGKTDGYAPLRHVLQSHAQWLSKPLVVVHGDTHRHKHDRPMRAAPGLVRIEVDGWPALGWLVVRPSSDAGDPFSVERRLHY
jgi:hypothetical protein